MASFRIRNKDTKEDFTNEIQVFRRIVFRTVSGTIKWTICSQTAVNNRKLRQKMVRDCRKEKSGKGGFQTTKTAEKYPLSWNIRWQKNPGRISDEIKGKAKAGADEQKNSIPAFFWRWRDGAGMEQEPERKSSSEKCCSYCGTLESHKQKMITLLWKGHRIGTREESCKNMSMSGNVRKAKKTVCPSTEKYAGWSRK